MVSYDFGLTEQQLSRAKKLRDESIVIDMLFQGPIGTYALPEEMEKELMALARQKHPYDEMGLVNMAGRLIQEWSIDGKLSDLYQEWPEGRYRDQPRDSWIWQGSRASGEDVCLWSAGSAVNVQ